VKDAAKARKKESRVSIQNLRKNTLPAKNIVARAPSRKA
jgi:hypothetical protein